MSKDDVEAYAKFDGERPLRINFPNANKWYRAVEEKLISSYIGKESIGGQAGPVETKEYTALHSLQHVLVLDDRVSERPFISGEEMTELDAEVYGLQKGRKPNPKYFLNANKWYEAVWEKLISRFLEKAGWGGRAAAPAEGNPLKRKREEEGVEAAKAASNTKNKEVKNWHCVSLTMPINWPWDEERSERYKEEIRKDVRRNFHFEGLVEAEAAIHRGLDSKSMKLHLSLIVDLELDPEEGVPDMIGNEVYSQLSPWLRPVYYESDN